MNDSEDRDYHDDLGRLAPKSRNRLALFATHGLAGPGRKTVDTAGGRRC